jgi:hypothetical protein
MIGEGQTLPDHRVWRSLRIGVIGEGLTLADQVAR